MRDDLLKSLKLHRDNLVNLLREDAPSNKFLAELIELKEIVRKLNLKMSWRLDAALGNALEDYKYSSKIRRRLMISDVYEVIKEIDEALLGKREIKPGDIPQYETVISEEEIINCFIDRGRLSGEWFKEFPVGLKKVLEKVNEERGKSLEWLSDENLFLTMCKHVDLILVESTVKKVHERLKEKDVMLIWKIHPEYLFARKSVYLIEAKSKREKIPEAVEQILQYRTLFEQDWPASKVKGVGIICKEWTKSELDLCKKNNIIAWEVTCQDVMLL